MTAREDLVAHVVDIDTRFSLALNKTSETEHRWRCSCGQTGAWKNSARWARAGGERHVEKSKGR